MSSWAQFRKTWVKPEVYPLIGSMVAALGVCGASIVNKLSQPTLTFNKSARKGGIFEQFEGIDEVTPGMANWSKSKSQSIFDSSTEIIQNKHEHLVVPTIEVVDDAEEATEEALAMVAEAVEEAREAVVEAVAETVEAVKEKVEDVVPVAAEESAEEKLLEKGAELVAELKSVA